MVTRALFIGRFQPFHKGHLHAVTLLLKEYDELIIMIGSAESNDTDNPFSPGMRIDMIRAAIPKKFHSRVLLVPVRDVNNHSLWVSHCISYLPFFSDVYSNNELVRELFKSKGYAVHNTPELKRSVYQGVRIRSCITEQKPWQHLVPKGVIPFILQSLQKRLL